MGTGENGLAVLVDRRIRAEKEAVATDNHFVIRIPDNQLLIRLLHLVIFVKVHGISRGAAGFAEGYFTQPADFRDDMGRILPRNDVELVVPLVGILQFLVGSKLCLDKFDRYGINDGFHRADGVSRYAKARDWK